MVRCSRLALAVLSWVAWCCEAARREIQLTTDFIEQAQRKAEASKRRSSTITNVTDVFMTDAPPLCDSAIVKEVCADLSPDNGTVTQGYVADRLSANADSVMRLWDVLNLPDDPSCSSLCHAVIAYAGEVAVLPEASDMACYTIGTDVLCDRYVGPDVLSDLGPKGDLPSTLIERESSSKTPQSPSGDEQDPDEEDLELEKGDLGESGSLMPDGAVDGIDYGTWEIVKRIAMLFRIFPSEKPSGDSSLAELSEASFLGPGSLRWPAGGKERTEQAHASAKAYVAHAIAAFNYKRTKNQMHRWFGLAAFDDDRSRRTILATLNSVLRMIDNVYFVPKGRECSQKTYAYVYPKSSKCDEAKVVSSPCTTVNGKFVFYLCPYYFQKPEEMVETLVHEASHHATAYLDDVKFDGGTAYGRRTCKALASRMPRGALKNADNLCYYVQDVADEIPSTGGAEAKIPVVVRPEVPVTPEPDDAAEAEEEFEEGEPTCMRSGPQGMYVKSMKPDKAGNCQCKYDSLTCFDGEEKKCPIRGRSAPHAHKFAASCYTCSCKYH